MCKELVKRDDLAKKCTQKYKFLRSHAVILKINEFLKTDACSSILKLELDLADQHIWDAAQKHICKKEKRERET